MGDISVLKKNIDPDPKEPHSFDNPQKDVVIAYCRDRGEEKQDVKAIHFKTKEIFCHGCNEDFTYLFDPKDNKWFYKQWDALSMDELTIEMCNKKD